MAKAIHKKSAAEVWMSIRAYAKTIPIDEKAVRDARDKRLLGKGAYDEATKKVNRKIADKNWGESQKIIKPKAGVSSSKALEKLQQQKGANLPPDLDKLPEQSLSDLLKSIRLNADMDTTKAIKLREVIGLALDKRKLEESEGILVRRDLVENALFNVGNKLKKALQEMPAKIAFDLLGCKNEIEVINILTEEINKILTAFVALKKNDLLKK